MKIRDELYECLVPSRCLSTIAITVVHVVYCTALRGHQDKVCMSGHLGICSGHNLGGSMQVIHKIIPF